MNTCSNLYKVFSAVHKIFKFANGYYNSLDQESLDQELLIALFKFNPSYFTDAYKSHEKSYFRSFRIIKTTQKEK